MLYALVFLLLTSATAAQSNLSELLSILRRQGPVLSDTSRARMFEIITSYGKGDKSFDGEWETINEGLTDVNPFVRDQIGAMLAATIYVNSVRPMKVPEITKDIVIQRFSDSVPNLRENAVRIIWLSDGGIPPAVVPKLLEMARTDSSTSVRRAAIAALASIRTPVPEITEFWVTTLSDTHNTQLRGNVLNAFRTYAQTDPRIISLVIDALKDTDYFVRQEAIASVIKIGKPAAAALPLLKEIRDGSSSENERDRAMRLNAESAIRLLSESPVR